MLSKKWFSWCGFHALLGFIIILITFPKFLMEVIDDNIPDPIWQEALHAPIETGQFVLAFLIGPNPKEFFERAMTCSFVLLCLFLVLLAVFFVRRQNMRMFGYGAGGIVLGFLALHVTAWAAVAIAVIFKGVISVGHWVSIGVGEIAAFVSHYKWPILVLAVVCSALLVYRLYGQIIAPWILRMIRTYATHLLGTGVVIGLLWLLVPAIYRTIVFPALNFLGRLFTPVIDAILFVVGQLFTIIVFILLVAFAIVVVLFSMALLGSLFVTQLQAGWHAARSLRHVLIAGFAIGSALGLIVLVSVPTPAVASSLNQALINSLAFLHLANPQSTSHFLTSAFEFLLPQSVENFALSYLTNLQAPAFDSFIFLAVTSMSSLSVLFRVFSTRPIEEEYVPVRLVVMEYINMMGGLFVALVMIFLPAESGDSQAS